MFPKLIALFFLVIKTIENSNKTKNKLSNDFFQNAKKKESVLSWCHLNTPRNRYYFSTVFKSKFQVDFSRYFGKLVEIAYEKISFLDTHRTTNKNIFIQLYIEILTGLSDNVIVFWNNSDVYSEMVLKMQLIFQNCL